MTKKVAMPLPGFPSVVTLADGKRMERSAAIKAGYSIVSPEDASRLDSITSNSTPANAERRWSEAVSALPEARARPSATSAILANHTSNNLSVASARAFLRGLPPEQQKAEIRTNMTSNDPRAARLKEINASMAGYNSSRGYTPPARKHAFQSAIDDPVKLKRLAEIRLSALQTRAATADKGEATNLRYALEVHDQTGKPLKQVFAQLNIDTSKFIAKES